MGYLILELFLNLLGFLRARAQDIELELRKRYNYKTLARIIDKYNWKNAHPVRARAFVKVTLEYPQCCSEDFATTLGRLPEVVEGHFTDGDEDMLLKVVSRDPENLREVLNEINAVEGIANTKTIISLTNPIREY